MKIYFTASTQNLSDKNRYDLLKQIEQMILDYGHTLTSEWIDEASFRIKQNQYDRAVWKEVSKKSLTSVEKADAAIIEASVDSYSMGFQTAVCLQHKIPVLILQSNKVVSRSNSNASSSVDHSSAASQINDDATLHKYQTMNELKVVIKKFLDDHSLKKSDMRFNMLLDRNSYHFLHKESLKTGISRSELVRRLIDNASKSKYGENDSTSYTPRKLGPQQ